MGNEISLQSVECIAMSHPVHSITDAPLKHSDEQRGRMIRYSVAMGIRIVCFIAAAVVAVVFESAWALAFAAAAIVLPYVAVVDANAGAQRYGGSRTPVEEPERLLSDGHEEPESVPEPRLWWEDEEEEPVSGDSSGAIISGEIEDDGGQSSTSRDSDH